MTRTPAAKTSPRSGRSAGAGTSRAARAATRSSGTASPTSSAGPSRAATAKTTRRTAPAAKTRSAAPATGAATTAGRTVPGKLGFQEHYVSGARRALTRSESQLHALRKRAGDLTTDGAGQFAELFRELEAANLLTEAKLARLVPGSDGWDEAATGYEQAMRAFRRLLNTTRAGLDAEPDTGGSLVPAAVRNQLEAWEEQVDELIVQAHLAGMDLRDEIDKLTEQFHDLRRTVRRVAIETPVEQAGAQLRGSFRALANAWEKLRRQVRDA